MVSKTFLESPKGDFLQALTQECSDCRGSGKYEGLFETGNCKTCNGQGKKLKYDDLAQYKITHSKFECQIWETFSLERIEILWVAVPPGLYIKQLAHRFDNSNANALELRKLDDESLVIYCTKINFEYKIHDYFAFVSIDKNRNQEEQEKEAVELFETTPMFR